MTTTPHVLQSHTRLSRSRIWSLQRESYSEQGPSAWRRGGVPTQIVSNPFIARAYAEVIHGLLCDLAAEGALRDPVTVLELGAGSGRFGYLLALALQRLERESLQPAAAYQIVLTDVARSNLAAWRQHPRLRPLLESGRIDIARFDAGVDSDVWLERSRRSLSERRAPIVAVANYVFDSIPQDAFEISGGALRSHHVGLAAPDAAERSPAETIAALSLQGTAVPLEPYHEPRRDGILAAYARALEESVFLIPEGALRCIDHLSARASGGLMVLASDKGQSALSALEGQRRVPLVRHGGTFSMGVNFDAIARYVRASGGHYVQSLRGDSALLSSLSLLGRPPDRAGRALEAFARRFRGFGPSDYQRLRDGLQAMEGAPAPSALLSLARLSDYDPAVFLRFKSALLARADQMDDGLLLGWRLALERSWRNDFPIAGQETDLAFEIATFFQVISRPGDALTYYERSLREHGDHFATRFNQAHCLIDMGRLEEALVAAQRAASLAPDSAEAPSLIERLRAALGR